MEEQMCSMLARGVGRRAAAAQWAKGNIARKHGSPRLALPTACLLGFAALCGQLSPAAAQVNWGSPQVYDRGGGFKPSVAGSGSTAVEVHVATVAPGPLWYRTGQIGRVNIWDASHPFPNPENGFNPSVAVSGSTAVVMYNTAAAAGPPPLHYRIGQVTGSTIPWGNPQPHDNGYNPSVAMSGSLIVEVHNATAALGPLLSRVGRVKGSTITWGPSLQYEKSGFNPRVALSGTTVVEIHNETPAQGMLWYRTGIIDEGQLRINWSSPSQFPQGANSALVNPSVALSGSTVIAVYSGPDTGGRRPLLYMTGETAPHGATETIRWGNGNWIDSGSYPSVAAVVRGKDAAGQELMIAIEVHNETNAAGPLWYHEGRVDTGQRTFVLKPKLSDVTTSRESHNSIDPLCISGEAYGVPNPKSAAGQTIVGFWDQYSGPAASVPSCVQKRETIYRGSVLFDLSKFDSIIEAHLGFDIGTRDRQGGTGSGPPCAATKLGMSTGFKPSAQPTEGLYRWDFNNEVPLPSDCKPPTVEPEGQPKFVIPVTSQVQAWVKNPRGNQGFILAGPRMAYNNDLPTDNDRNITIYGGFQLKILFDPKHNPRFHE
jgi:hypothetical protein